MRRPPSSRPLVGALGASETLAASGVVTVALAKSRRGRSIIRRFTAPLVCDRVDVDLLVLVAAMIPAPGEAPNDYWANTRYVGEVHERYDDEIALFYQDPSR